MAKGLGDDPLKRRDQGGNTDEYSAVYFKPNSINDNATKAIPTETGFLERLKQFFGRN